ncbi:molybdenum cofactor guanylyltransferase [Salinicoccus albus]|uniref:molybdenum cofactor guanylyltransferase n=1 Tax=Salinicoccus albus TaxID=418756 RepID=UPI000368E7BC|nr:molybdenum cofactor guanylyltransferase [Salinicoccus albus]
METLGVILAGGRSTRFGEDKSFYKLAGQPMYQHIADILSRTGVCSDIVISTNAALQDDFDNYVTVTDDERFTDKGPLGGLHAAAGAYPEARLMVMSCDTPYVPPDWMVRLHDTAAQQPGSIIVTAEADRLHPLIGVYQGEDLAGRLESQLVSDRLSMRAFFDNNNVTQLDATEYGVTEKQLVNINKRRDIL